MARQCVVCGKKPMVGYHVSHSMRHVKRRFLPNLQKIRIVLNGATTREWVCTSCIRANKVKRPA